jgi:hypothetical protein
MSEFDEDPSASTAQFRAFADRDGTDNPAPWHMRVPPSRVFLFAVGVIVVAVIAGTIALTVAG